MNDRKPGPNDPCHCGSGRKYKKCHMSADAAGVPGVVEAPKTEHRGPPQLNETERNGMRRACAFNAQLMDEVREIIKPGMTTQQIDDFVREYTHAHGHKCATMGYRGYTRNCCTSVNHVICHGIPGRLTLKDGDIINVVLTTIVDGWHGDQSETLFVGEVSDEAVRLVQCSFDAMWAAIEAIGPGSKVVEIGRAIKKVADAQGYSSVKDFYGHGIGRKFHQPPHIPHYPEKRNGNVVLHPGVCFTIEPMISQGTWRAVVDETDGWTAYTADGKLSAQFEHTLLMTETGPEVMTLTKNGPQKGHKFASVAQVA